jgi:large subunit ribosomal protein L30e
VNIERMLKAVIETGELRYGLKQCKKTIAKDKAKLLVLANNCPDGSMENTSVKTYNFEGTNVELGRACGKPFPISALVIVDEGTSNILSSV